MQQVDGDSDHIENLNGTNICPHVVGGHRYVLGVDWALAKPPIPAPKFLAP